MADKSNLPFEIISYNDNNQKKITFGLKRVEIFLKPNKVDSVIQSIKNVGFEATLYDSKGFGKEKQKVRQIEEHK